MRRRSAAFAISALCAVSCTESSTKKETLRLDERLKPGQTRAGLITQPSELLTGNTAKGRVGDYKIYNSKIAVVIAEPGVSRGFQPYGGIILDADRVRPAGQVGGSTYGEVVTALDLQIIEAKTVEVINDGSNGEPARLRFLGAEGVFPLFDTFFSEIFPQQKHEMNWDVEYILEPDADHLRIQYTMTNTGRLPIDIGLPIAGFIFGDGARPFLPLFGFNPPGSGGVGEYYGAIAEDVSYLYGRADASVTVILSESGIVVSGLGDSFTLRGRESKKIEHVLVVGDGDLARSQALWRRAIGAPELPVVEGRVVDSRGRPVRDARVHLLLAEPRTEERDYLSYARTDAEGRFALAAEPGAYRAIVSASGKRTGAARDFTVEAGRGLTGIDLTIDESGVIAYDFTDEQNRPLPVKMSIRSENGGAVQLPARFGDDVQGSGLFATVFAVYGKGELELPAGDYRIWSSRGSEYEVDEKLVTVTPGGRTELAARLERTVNSEGWLSTDTHVHSQMSPDSPDLFSFKISAMVTEGLEMPVSTEHEAIGDFNPTIREMGLEEWIQGVIGSEITTYIYGHFNAFPMIQDFDKPGNGRIEWYKKPPAETFALIRANPGDPFLQVNHPRSPAIGGYLSAMGFDADAFAWQKPNEASMNFDALEVSNGCDYREVDEVTGRDWFAFLNKSHRIYATGATDNHRAAGGDMGYPRTYVRMPTDEPGTATIDDFRAAMKAGRLIVSCGPFVEMKIGDAEIGDTARVTGGTLAISARVAAPSWMDVDLIEVIVNGVVVSSVELPAAVEGTAGDRFTGTIEVPIEAGRDGWVILRVRGDRNHGVWARNRPSFAFTNPIFLDGNDDGAWVMP